LSWFVLGAFAILAILIHLAYRRHHQFGSARPTAAAAVTSPGWLRAMMIVVFLAIFTSFDPLGRRGGVPPTVGQIVAWGMVSFVAMMALQIAILVVYAYATRYDRLSAQAHKRAREGDLDGAILELQGDVEARPPTANRLNGLGLLLLRREDWETAHERFRQALDLEPKRPEFRNNLALSLIELGRASEAEPMLSALAETFPRDPVIVQNHARGLIALGRLDEAEARLIQAEAAMARGGPYRNKGLREEIRKALAKNRVRLSEARRSDVGETR
jgi:tetratricopeptide (TPR) repeat protein